MELQDSCHLWVLLELVTASETKGWTALPEGRIRSFHYLAIGRYKYGNAEEEGSKCVETTVVVGQDSNKFNWTPFLNSNDYQTRYCEGDNACDP